MRNEHTVSRSVDRFTSTSGSGIGRGEDIDEANSALVGRIRPGVRCVPLSSASFVNGTLNVGRLWRDRIFLRTIAGDRHLQPSFLSPTFSIATGSGRVFTFTGLPGWAITTFARSSAAHPHGVKRRCSSALLMSTPGRTLYPNVSWDRFLRPF